MIRTSFSNWLARLEMIRTSFYFRKINFNISVTVRWITYCLKCLQRITHMMKWTSSLFICATHIIDTFFLVSLQFFESILKILYCNRTVKEKENFICVHKSKLNYSVFEYTKRYAELQKFSNKRSTGNTFLQDRTGPDRIKFILFFESGRSQ